MFERERRTVSGFLLGVWLLMKICKLNGKKIIQMEKFGGAFAVDPCGLQHKDIDVIFYAKIRSNRFIY